MFDTYEGGACLATTPPTCASPVYVCSGKTSTCKIPVDSTNLVCASNASCFDGSTCVSGVCSIAAPLPASCEAVKTATPTAANGYYLINPTLSTGSPDASYSTLVYCDMTNDLGGWIQIMTLNTNDSNVLDYANTDFWAGATLLGGATSDPQRSFMRDYKHAYIFANVPVKAIQIQVHIEGVLQYWRSWTAQFTTQPLRHYFTAPALYGSANYQVTSAVRMTGGSPWINDPVIVDSNNLFSHTCTGSNDYNRLSQLPTGHAACGPVNNVGWGFGTSYDYAPGTYVVCSRPCSDVEARAVAGTNWVSGIIGTDINPTNQYGTQAPAPYGNYDYSIFIR
eukprot:TRINITY_DN18669_c0_g1_i1.p1 TRINITY_DN18669_c0_g1~~TRINITY_DN18669_c0_g1_i1.p1  ORF type:complete len:337 (+),score=27.30 TRINITY_DN18669_c0_g1_i1:203-1213(+)